MTADDRMRETMAASQALSRCFFFKIRPILFFSKNIHSYPWYLFYTYILILVPSLVLAFVLILRLPSRHFLFFVFFILDR